MTYAVTLALLLEYAVKQRQWLRPALFLGGNMLCTAALGWALGLALRQQPPARAGAVRLFWP